MKGTKALSFLLAFALLASLVIPGSFAMPAKAEDDDNGLHISKTATDNGNGTYTITLEAYATGSQLITEVKTDVPADIVLVLDQSGSMKETMNSYDFRLYSGKTNSNYYNLRHNSNNTNNANLYFKLEDGGYATVSVVRTVIANSRYTECSKSWTNEDYSFRRNNLYVKVGEEYKKVSLSVSYEWDWDAMEFVYTYTYTFPDGTYTSVGSDTSPGDFGGKGPLYYYSNNNQQQDYAYTYSYTDQNGVTHEIGTSQGNNTTPDYPLYERYVSGSSTRLVALQNAVTNFANTVAQKAAGADGKLGTEDDVDHRIAVVGFACSNTGDDDDYNNYQNTELFIGSTQYKYGAAAQEQYSKTFQDMRTQGGRDNITASIDALTADGATYVNHGLEIANGILTANPVPEGKTRSRVVVVFTDGAPGYSGYDSNVASSAITQANNVRANGADVYAVGIFEGADATSSGNQNGTDTQKANWFMQNLSNNKGTPRSPSYYLSASDAGTLNSIFQQIANNIESGGSSTTLGSSAVVKDIIAPQFQLPEGATADNIILKAYAYIGENQWSENSVAVDATATVNGNQVSVTGFDFSENWCGTVTENENTTYRGNKLVISFTVEVRDGFLGGNGVYTNTNAGIYQDASATEPVARFERPWVDIAILEITVDAPNKDIYLLQDVELSDLLNGTTVKAGNVEIDLSQADSNYGLEDWQTEYVTITVEVKDKDGVVISNDITGLREDNSYTVSVTVSPKNTEGDATAEDGSNTGNIYVYKPVLTYKDSDVYYGDTVPADFSSNLVSTVWKHGTTEADTATMGDAPLLTKTYTPDSSKIDNGKINTKQDVPVDVSVKIGAVDVTNYVDFVHQGCTDTETLPDGKEFLLHVKTCQLTITKTGGASGEPYVFTVYKDGEKYTEASITGNGSVIIYELPVGTYTIAEDTGWSWRYTPGYSDGGNGVTLSSEIPNGSITCTNRQTKNFWLNGFSTVVQNIFGEH